MFIFAHAFCGALIGLLFWHFAGDRRALPVCIFGAVLPDLLDKSLAFLFPAALGSGRTIGHGLLFLVIVFASGVLIWKYRHTLLGIAFACAVLSHQLLDEMWAKLASWCYPFLGPFPLYFFPDYAGSFFWLEVSNPSEWVFGFATLVILVAWYLMKPEHRLPCISTGIETFVLYCVILLLVMLGVCFLGFGLMGGTAWFLPATYSPSTSLLAGIVALAGAGVLLWYQKQHPLDVRDAKRPLD